MTYEFEGFRLDTDRRRLLAAPSGDPIQVSPKVLETLIYLVERRGELVEKDALMRAIWPRVVVEENNLDRNISTLRRVLGEKAGENRFIATVPGQGYRFVATVTTAGERAAGAAAIASTYEAVANPAKRPAALAALRYLASTVPFGEMQQRRWSLLLWLYTQAGDLGEAYAAGNRALDEAARSGSIGSSWYVIWFPSLRPFRQDPRFQAYAQRLNLVRYWEVYGPPDGCALDDGKIACQ